MIIAVLKKHRLSILLAFATALYLALLAAQLFPFGNKSAWSYPYLYKLSAADILLFATASGIFTAFLCFCAARIKQNEKLWLWSAIAAGGVFQLFALSLRIFSPEEIVANQSAYSFFNGAQAMNLGASIRLFEYYKDFFPAFQHMHTNMAGKVVLTKLFELSGMGPAGIAYLTIALCVAGAVAVYYLCKNFFKPETAFYAAVLYLLIPSATYFMPVLNTLTAVFTMLMLLTLFSYLTKPSILKGVLCGAGFYLLAFFEPTPVLFLLLIATGLFIRIKKEYPDTNIPLFILIPAASFMLMDTLAIVFLRYDLIKNFMVIYRNGGQYTLHTQSAYWSWMLSNTRDFFVNAGFPSSILFFITLTKNIKNPLSNSFIVSASLLGTVAAMNLSAMCGSEAARVWLFLMPACAISAADSLTGENRQTVFCVSVIALALQLLATVKTIGFILI